RAFALVGVISLFVGAFLVYLTTSMNLRERMQNIGVLIALGTSRGQLVGIIIVEAALIGIVSTAAGLGLGLVVAKLLLWLVANQLDVAIHGIVVGRGPIFISSILGVGVTLAASIPPALTAATIDVSQVIKASRNPTDLTKQGIGWVVGCALIPFGTAIGLFVKGHGWAPRVGIITILLGSVLVVPSLIRILGSFRRRHGRGMRSLIPAIALAYPERSPKRSGYALGLLTVVMAMVFATLAVQKSIEQGLASVIDRQFGPDLLITGATLFNPSFDLPASFENALRHEPGIDQVAAISYRFMQTETGRRSLRPLGMAVDFEEYLRVAGFAWESGTDGIARKGLASGRGILLANTFARSLNLSMGDPIRINADGSTKQFRVTAIFKAFAGPAVVVQRSSEQASRLPNAYQIKMSGGFNQDALKKKLRESLGRKYEFQVQTASGIKAQARTDLEKSTRVFFALVLLTSTGGALALANTALITVYERRREIGVLRSLGVSTFQFVGIVLGEACFVGATAFLLSVPLGVLIARVATVGVEAELGISSLTAYPLVWAPAIGILALGISLASSVAATMRTVSLKPTEAIRFE
ncbi:MAG: ABC transporter permease, partial [Actinobacteria bacterium]|nr:ABC transporter permease [Actinomycetota bacterium]